MFVYDNVLSDEICDELVRIIDEEAIQYEPYGKSDQNVQAKSIRVESIKEFEKYDAIIYDVMEKTTKKIQEDYKVTFFGDSGYNLRKIHGPTKEHSDSFLSDTDAQNISSKEIRNLSVIIALNSDYEGGELCFTKQNFSIKLKKGQMIAFPPFWTHPHYTNDLLNNTYRYTVNTWFYGT